MGGFIGKREIFSEPLSREITLSGESACARVSVRAHNSYRQHARQHTGQGTRTENGLSISVVCLKELTLTRTHTHTHAHAHAHAHIVVEHTTHPNNS